MTFLRPDRIAESAGGPTGAGRLLRTLALVASIAVVAAACGSGTDDESSSDDASSDDALGSPLFEALGLNEVFLNPNDVAGQQELQIAINESIQECMTAEGFEWQPSAASGSLFGGADAFDGLDPESREWAERYGFGVSTLLFAQEDVGPNLVGNNFGTGPEGEEDPNAAYLQGLSESDRIAYDEALFGENTFDFGDDVSDEELAAAQADAMLNPTGCLPTAQNEIFGTGLFAAVEEFGPEIDALFDSVFDDSRVAELEDQMRTCVQDDGIEYVSPNDVYDHFFAQTQDFIDAQVAFSSPDDGPVLTDEQIAKLGDVQRDEVSLAVAMFDCGEEVGFEDTVNTVRVEYEAKFVTDNQARIDSITG